MTFLMEDGGTSFFSDVVGAVWDATMQRALDGMSDCISLGVNCGSPKWNMYQNEQPMP